MGFAIFTLKKLIRDVMLWSEIKIKQLSQFIDLLGETELESLMQNLKFRAKVVSIFREIPYPKVMASHVDDVIRISNIYLDLLLSYKVEEPKGKVLIEGKWYTFELDRNKWTAGQIIDAKMMTPEDIKEHPERLLAIFYLNGEYDGDTKETAELFAKKFDPIEYWNFLNFFLSNLEQRKVATLAVMTARAMAMTQKLQKEQAMNGSFGQRIFVRLRNFGVFRWMRLRNSRM